MLSRSCYYSGRDSKWSLCWITLLAYTETQCKMCSVGNCLLIFFPRRVVNPCFISCVYRIPERLCHRNHWCVRVRVCARAWVCVCCAHMCVIYKENINKHFEEKSLSLWWLRMSVALTYICCLLCSLFYKKSEKIHASGNWRKSQCLKQLKSDTLVYWVYH